MLLKRLVFKHLTYFSIMVINIAAKKIIRFLLKGGSSALFSFY